MTAGSPLPRKAWCGGTFRRRNSNVIGIAMLRTGHCPQLALRYRLGMAGLNSSLHHPVRIVIVGGGYVGMYNALGLQKKLGPGSAEITVIDPQSNMTYQPFLPEAAAGSVEP